MEPQLGAQCSIQHGRKDLIDSLSASGVNLQCDSDLKTAIEAATTRGDISVIRLLLNNDSTYRASVVKSLGCSLCYAISKGHSELTEMLLTVGADVNCSSASNSTLHRTPLFAAILRKDADLSQRLLASGAAVNTRNIPNYSNPYHGMTTSVLPAAVACGNYPLVQGIISAGAEIDAPDSNEGKTALTVAVEKGDFVTIQLLMDASAEVNSAAAADTSCCKALQPLFGTTTSRWSAISWPMVRTQMSIP